MFMKSLPLVLAIVAVTVSVGPVFATSQDSDAARAAKVKADVAKRGVGEKARVKVKLQDKTEVKGYVYQAGEDGFTVADSKTGAKTTVAYNRVEKVRGTGLSTGAKIGIWVGIGVGIVVAGAVAAAHSLGNIEY